jgi:hypothetical protein
MDRRKLTLQLTPLLDLLLIVIFAQYMEVRTVANKQTERVELEREEARADLATVQQQLAALQQQLAEWEQKQHQTDQAEYAGREQLGRLFGELFRIPESAIQKIADRRSTDEAVLSPAEFAALKAEFKALSTARADQVVDHLLTFAEMKKRFDVWEIYIQDDQSLLVTVGSHTKRLQKSEIDTAEQFSDEFFKLYKSFPQSKSVVLILVSYGEVRLKYRLSVINGLPKVVERMRQDSNSSVKFEYAVLGFRPDLTRPSDAPSP